MIFLANNLVERERQQVEDITRLSRQLPLAFLIIFLGVVVYQTNFLAHQIVRPLNRFVDYTIRIAQGDYTPITPVRDTKTNFPGWPWPSTG